MAFFPELFSNRNDKLGRLAIWMVTREGVVCPNVRYLFTAGGKSDLIINNKVYKNVPRIFVTLIENIEMVVEAIVQTSPTELSEHWQQKTTDKNKLNYWMELVSNEAKKIPDSRHLDIKEMLAEAL